jgi:hypothetical protein
VGARDRTAGLVVIGLLVAGIGVVIAALAWLFPFQSEGRSPLRPPPPSATYLEEFWDEVDLDRLGPQPGCVEYCDAIYLHSGPRPSRIGSAAVAHDWVRYRAVCQDEGVEQWDNQGNRSTMWTKIEYEPGRFGYTNEVWFGFHGRVLAPCPSG